MIYSLIWVLFTLRGMPNATDPGPYAVDAYAYTSARRCDDAKRRLPAGVQGNCLREVANHQIYNDPAMNPPGFKATGFKAPFQTALEIDCKNYKPPTPR